MELAFWKAIIKHGQVGLKNRRYHSRYQSNAWYKKQLYSITLSNQKRRL